ncbi:hypothetical protein Tco_1123854 [Tanacetum coccineum]|uniref:Uncharacterized protein n=1 Tax=Tanacetum coccineum TaxID=301880 RepID=A0ABQ5J8C1_9ASTR
MSRRVFVICFIVSNYNLAFFVAKRMELATKQARLILPYSMLLTRLFNHVKLNNPEFSNDRYIFYDRVMYPFATQHEQKTRKDYSTKRGRHSTSASSLSAFGQPSSSHHIDDDNDGNDEGTSRASTPSPTHFFNSLSNDVPQVFSNPPHNDPNMEAFFIRQTKILNCQVQLRDEHQNGLRSIGKAIKNLLRGKKKHGMCIYSHPILHGDSESVRIIWGGSYPVTGQFLHQDSYFERLNTKSKSSVIFFTPGGILQRLEAFVASPIGCGGSDVEIA